MNLIVEYVDTITWNLLNISLTPEIFAKTTCIEQGLPIDFAPIIAFKIRESIYRHIICLLDENASQHFKLPIYKTEGTIIESHSRSTAQAYLYSSQTHIDMISSIWKKMKPSSVSDTGIFPYALIPQPQQLQLDENKSAIESKSTETSII
jgi:hypothetical protein